MYKRQDLYSANCECAGALIDCAGTAGGTSLPGTTCDDGIACTTADAWANDCTCSGTPVTIGNVMGAVVFNASLWYYTHRARSQNEAPATQEGYATS